LAYTYASYLENIPYLTAEITLGTGAKGIKSAIKPIFNSPKMKR
jgi:hypothetical protein